MPFFRELLSLSWTYFFRALGTTGLGFTTGVCLYSLLTIFLTLLGVGLYRGIAAMMLHWKETAALTICVTIAAILLLYGPIFLWQLCVTVPRQINEEARKAVPNYRMVAALRAPSPPPLNVSLHVPDKLLTFKDSPLFTDERKEIITKNVKAIDRYFRQIHLDVPNHFPTIGVLNVPPHSCANAGIVSPLDYQQSLEMPSNCLDNPQQITRAYSGYVIYSMLPPVPTPKISTEAEHSSFPVKLAEYASHPDWVNDQYRKYVSAGISMYLNWSFWNKQGDDVDAPCKNQFGGAVVGVNNVRLPTFPIPARYFWARRQKYRQKFADDLVVRLVKYMRDKPHTDPAEGFDEYFVNHLGMADFDLDDGTRFADLKKIYEACDWEKKAK